VLTSEWLTIVRFRELDTFKLIVAGMHGYSTEAFCRNITASLEQVARIVGALEQYQVLVPVALRHFKDATGMHSTIGNIDWSASQVQELRN
jgi:hypothetical protein